MILMHNWQFEQRDGFGWFYVGDAIKAYWLPSIDTCEPVSEGRRADLTPRGIEQLLHQLHTHSAEVRFTEKLFRDWYTFSASVHGVYGGVYITCNKTYEGQLYCTIGRRKATYESTRRPIRCAPFCH